MGKGYSCLQLVKPESKAKHLCLVKRCRNTKAPNRRVCYCHHLQAWRLNNPDKAAYRTLKDHAVRRKIRFTLTFSEFLKVAESTGYIDHKGTFADDLQIDRIDALRGYEYGNIRVISCSENASKGATFDKEAYRQQKISNNKKGKQNEEQIDEENCPF